MVEALLILLNMIFNHFLSDISVGKDSEATNYDKNSKVADSSSVIFSFFYLSSSLKRSLYPY